MMNWGMLFVNFYDPVVLSGDWIEYAGRRDTAYSIPLNSKYYNGYYKNRVGSFENVLMDMLI